MNKQKLAFLAITVGALALTACGGGNDSSVKSSKTRPSISFSEEEESISSLPPAVDPTVKINGGAPTQVARGTAITKPADPEVPAGKKFLGWKNVKNAGQIWNFDNEKLNRVLDDVELEPCFVDDVDAQYLEAELCPDIQTTPNPAGGMGMPGSTYSGGQSGKGLIYKDRSNEFGGTTTVGQIQYYRSTFYNLVMDVDDPDVALLEDKKELITETITCGAFVEFMYVKDDTLTFEINVSEACTNVPLVARWTAEYGILNRYSETTEYFTDDDFVVSVNGTQVKYGEVTFYQIPTNRPDFFQDFYLGSVNLNKGKNTITTKVDNLRTLNGTIKSSAPVFDSLKLFTSSTVEVTNMKPSNLVDDTSLQF